MLIGEFSHAIDSKGRLIIPAKLRDDLGGSFVLTRGLDGCIFGYPMASWERVEEKLKALPLAKKTARSFTRFFYAAAASVNLDKQGRINIPQNLLDYADIKKNCQVIGMNDRIEIWSEERWQEYNESLSEGVEDLAEELFDLGL